jgi:hypothetical protein
MPSRASAARDPVGASAAPGPPDATPSKGGEVHASRRVTANGSRSGPTGRRWLSGPRSGDGPGRRRPRGQAGRRAALGLVLDVAHDGPAPVERRIRLRLLIALRHAGPVRPCGREDGPVRGSTRAGGVVGPSRQPDLHPEASPRRPVPRRLRVQRRGRQVQPGPAARASQVVRQGAAGGRGPRRRRGPPHDPDRDQASRAVPARRPVPLDDVHGVQGAAGEAGRRRVRRAALGHRPHAVRRAQEGRPRGVQALGRALAKGCGRQAAALHRPLRQPVHCRPDGRRRRDARGLARPDHPGGRQGRGDRAEQPEPGLLGQPALRPHLHDHRAQPVQGTVQQQPQAAAGSALRDRPRRDGQDAGPRHRPGPLLPAVERRHDRLRPDAGATTTSRSGPRPC